jgi:O-antigen ligase
MPNAMPSPASDRPERALAWTFAALLAALSFSHTTALIRVLLAATLGLAIVVAWHSRPGWREWTPPFAAPFVAWVAWCFASLLWSIDPAYTAYELRAESFYALVALPLAFFAAGGARAERFVLPALVAASAALAAASLAWFLGSDADTIPERTFGGPGVLTSTVLALFPVAAAAALTAEAGPVARRAGLAMAIALLAAGITTLNRTLWPALALQIVLVAALLRPPRAEVRQLAAIVALAVAFAVLQAVLVQHLRFAEDSPIAPSAPGFEDPRPKLWSHALERIASDPLTGAGFGRGILRNELPVHLGDGRLWHAHNIFLDAGLQLGVPGMALLVLLLAAVALTGVRLARRADALARACGAALVAVVAGMVARNFTDDVWVRQSALLYWVVCGTLAGIGARSLKRPGLSA